MSENQKQIIQQKSLFTASQVWFFFSYIKQVYSIKASSDFCAVQQDGT